MCQKDMVSKVELTGWKASLHLGLTPEGAIHSEINNNMIYNNKIFDFRFWKQFLVKYTL